MKIHGLDLDSHPLIAQNKSLSYAENIAIGDDNASYINEPGFESLNDLNVNISKYFTNEAEGTTIQIIGTIPINDGIVLFAIYGSNDCIIHLNQYDVVINQLLYAENNGLNFNASRPITGDYIYNYKTELIITFTEGVSDEANETRAINITSPYGGEYISEFPNVYKINTPEILNLIPDVIYPSINVTSIKGGNLKTGSYQIAIAYKLQDNSYTNYSILTAPTIIYQADDATLEPNAQSNQQLLVRFGISNEDTYVEYYNTYKLAIIHNSGSSILAYETDDIPIETGSDTTTVNEYHILTLDNYNLISLDDVLIKNISYIKEQTLVNYNNKLIRGNVKTLDYKTLNNSLSEFVKNNVEIDCVANDNPIDENTPYFKFNEVYVFYIGFFDYKGDLINIYPISNPGNQVEQYNISESFKGFKMKPNMKNLDIKGIDSNNVTPVGTWTNVYNQPINNNRDNYELSASVLKIDGSSLDDRFNVNLINNASVPIPLSELNLQHINSLTNGANAQLPLYCYSITNNGKHTNSLLLDLDISLKFKITTPYTDDYHHLLVFEYVNNKYNIKDKTYIQGTSKDLSINYTTKINANETKNLAFILLHEGIIKGGTVTQIPTDTDDAINIKGFDSDNVSIDPAFNNAWYTVYDKSYSIEGGTNEEGEPISEESYYVSVKPLALNEDDLDSRLDVERDDPGDRELSLNLLQLKYDVPDEDIKTEISEAQASIPIREYILNNSGLSKIPISLNFNIQNVYGSHYYRILVLTKTDIYDDSTYKVIAYSEIEPDNETDYIQLPLYNVNIGDTEAIGDKIALAFLLVAETKTGAGTVTIQETDTGETINIKGLDSDNTQLTSDWNVKHSEIIYDKNNSAKLYSISTRPISIQNTKIDDRLEVTSNVTSNILTSPKALGLKYGSNITSQILLPVNLYTIHNNKDNVNGLESLETLNIKLEFNISESYKEDHYHLFLYEYKLGGYTLKSESNIKGNSSTNKILSLELSLDIPSKSEIKIAFILLHEGINSGGTITEQSTNTSENIKYRDINYGYYYARGVVNNSLPEELSKIIKSCAYFYIEHNTYNSNVLSQSIVIPDTDINNFSGNQKYEGQFQGNNSLRLYPFEFLYNKITKFKSRLNWIFNFDSFNGTTDTNGNITFDNTKPFKGTLDSTYAVRGVDDEQNPTELKGYIADGVKLLDVDLSELNTSYSSVETEESDLPEISLEYITNDNVSQQNIAGDSYYKTTTFTKSNFPIQGKLFIADLMNSDSELYSELYEQKLQIASSIHNLDSISKSTQLIGDTYRSYISLRITTPATSFRYGDSQFEEGDSNSTVFRYIMTYPVESKYNLKARFGANSVDKPYFLHNAPLSAYKELLGMSYKVDNYINTETGKGYNTVYNDNGIETFRYYKDIPGTADHPCRIIRSETQNPESISLNWRIFKTDNYKDMPFNKGQIISLKTDNKNLYVQQEHGLHILQQRDQLNVNDTGDSYLGTSDLFSMEPKEIIYSPTGFIGCKNIFDTYICSAGYVVVDVVRKHIFLINGNNVIDLSNIKLKRFFRDNLSEIITTRRVINFNENKNLLYVSQNNSDHDFTLSFSTINKVWVSFHTYKPDLGFNNRHGLFWIKDNIIYNHREYAKQGIYFDRYETYSIIQFILNDNAAYNKLLKTVTWKDSVDNEVDIVKQYNPNITIDKLMVHNDTQCSGELPVIGNHTEKKWYDGETGVNKINLWRFNKLFDIVKDPNQFVIANYINTPDDNLKSNPKWYDVNRFISQYIHLTMWFENKFGGRWVLIDINPEWTLDNRNDQNYNYKDNDDKSR